jgi:hypothetical protein
MVWKQSAWPRAVRSMPPSKNSPGRKVLLGVPDLLAEPRLAELRQPCWQVGAAPFVLVGDPD